MSSELNELNTNWTELPVVYLRVFIFSSVLILFPVKPVRRVDYDGHKASPHISFFICIPSLLCFLKKRLNFETV